MSKYLKLIYSLLLNDYPRVIILAHFIEKFLIMININKVFYLFLMTKTTLLLIIINLFTLILRF